MAEINGLGGALRPFSSLTQPAENQQASSTLTIGKEKQSIEQYMDGKDQFDPSVQTQLVKDITTSWKEGAEVGTQASGKLRQKIEQGLSEFVKANPQATQEQFDAAVSELVKKTEILKHDPMYAPPSNMLEQLKAIYEKAKEAQKANAY